MEKQIPITDNIIASLIIFSLLWLSLFPKWFVYKRLKTVRLCVKKTVLNDNCFTDTTSL